MIQALFPRVLIYVRSFLNPIEMRRLGVYVTDINSSKIQVQMFLMILAIYPAFSAQCDMIICILLLSLFEGTCRIDT